MKTIKVLNQSVTVTDLGFDEFQEPSRYPNMCWHPVRGFMVNSLAVNRWTQPMLEAAFAHELGHKRANLPFILGMFIKLEDKPPYISMNKKLFENYVLAYDMDADWYAYYLGFGAALRNILIDLLNYPLLPVEKEHAFLRIDALRQYEQNGYLKIGEARNNAYQP